MAYLEPFMLNEMSEYLKPVEEMWQPADFLPDSSRDTFFEEVKDLQGNAKELPYDLVAVLIGDTVTEEALPTYESWLTMVEGVEKNEQGGWMKWVRAWTAEENRHGDLLNKYLYLSGRIDMRQLEISMHHLIKDGFDIGTWFGMLAPAGTPAAVIDKLSRDITAIVSADDFRQRMLAAGAEPMTSTPQAFAERIDRETKKFAQLVKEHGITVN